MGIKELLQLVKSIAEVCEFKFRRSQCCSPALVQEVYLDFNDAYRARKTALIPTCLRVYTGFSKSNKP